MKRILRTILITGGLLFFAFPLQMGLDILGPRVILDPKTNAVLEQFTVSETGGLPENESIEEESIEGESNEEKSNEEKSNEEVAAAEEPYDEDYTPNNQREEQFTPIAAAPAYFLTFQEIKAMEHMGFWDRLKALSILRKLKGAEVKALLKIANGGVTMTELDKVNGILKSSLKSKDIKRLNSLIRKYRRRP